MQRSHLARRSPSQMPWPRYLLHAAHSSLAWYEPRARHPQRNLIAEPLRFGALNVHLLSSFLVKSVQAEIP